MMWTTWAAAAAALIAVAGSKIEPPPVILDMGQLQPTPAPTPEGLRKKRLVTVITIRNSAEGESTVAFEASDVATGGKDRVRTLASKSYALGSDDEKAALKVLSGKIVRQIRELERDMLEYAELAGPPKQNVPGERVLENKQPD